MVAHRADRQSAACAPAAAPPHRATVCPAPSPSDGHRCFSTPSHTAGTPPSPPPSLPPPPTSASRAASNYLPVAARAAAVVAVALSRAWLGLRVRVGLDTQIRTRPSRACPLLSSLTHHQGRRTSFGSSYTRK